MREGFESTVQICHRVLVSRNIQVKNGGLSVVLALNELDKNVPNCEDFKFGVTLTKSEDWWPDDEIGTCEARTGGTRSFSFANLSAGTYYLTIWRNFDHPYCCLEGDIFVFDEAVSSDSAGCTRDKDPSAMDIVHGALDIAGFIPVLGAIPDGVNAAIYAVEGDWTNAGLSAVAMVPAWGDGVKLGAMTGKSVIKISEKAAIRLGEDGLATGLKEVKAASKTVSKVEKSALVARIQAKLGLYPKVIDPRTGRHIAFPSAIGDRVGKADRVAWGSTERGAFIKEWHDRGLPTPRGGWDKYDIHHIQPREFGGSNDFLNLVPVERETHKLFNEFWREFIEL